MESEEKKLILKWIDERMKRTAAQLRYLHAGVSTENLNEVSFETGIITGRINGINSENQFLENLRNEVEAI